MQSFKQFLLLTEAETPTARLDIYIPFDEDVDDTDYLHRALYTLEIPGLEIVSYGGDSVSVEIKLDFNQLHNLLQSKKLHQYESNIFTTVAKIIKPIEIDKEYWTSEIVINTIPNFVIEWPSVIIDVQKDASFTGIGKVLKCEQLAINETFNIKDSILGLLSIKGLRIMFFGEGGLHWTEIVKKYLKSRDILACQEELIEAGFKQYAKL